MFTETERQKMFDRNEIKTPCFIIHVDKTHALIKDMQNAMREFFPTGIAGYSFKTNNLPWIISYMKGQGFWAEVVSSDEFKLAQELGYETSRIIFNGPVKGEEEFIEAVENGAIVNIDSKRELLLLKKCKNVDRSHIGLRVNFCLEESCPGESQCGEEDGRFGFSYENGDLKCAIEYLISNGFKLSGLHLHCSSKTRSLKIYEAIAKTAREIVTRYQLKLEYVDIGGGFFGGVDGKPSYHEYLGTVRKILNEESFFSDTKLIIEPGMSVIGASVDYITEVVDVKDTKNNTFVILNGSRIHIDPLMRKKSYDYSIISDFERISDGNKQILCGFTCMEGDRFLEVKDRCLSTGDIIVFEKVGAYTMGLSPQFIEAYPRVYAENKGEYQIVRDKQKLPSYMEG